MDLLLYVLYSCVPIHGVNLSQNRLTHVTGISPDPKFLTELRLGSNSLDDKSPSDILNIDSIKKIYILYNTRISGNVPSDIVKMTGLLHLVMSFTSLHGNIPYKFGIIKDHRYLGIDETHVHGPISSDLDNMQKIKYLSI